MTFDSQPEPDFSGSTFDEAPTTASSSERMQQESFGIIDIVEAFTAMRHDLKLQSRDGRKLIESVAEAINKLDQIRLDDTKTEDQETISRPYAEALAEVDETVRRTVDMVGRFMDFPNVSNRLSTQLQQLFDSQPVLLRKVAGKFFVQIQELVGEQNKEIEQAHPANLLEGLRIMGERVERITKANHITRIDVLGDTFDPNQMNAIEVVSDSKAKAGQVIDQVRPAYYWNDQLLRYAQVRIAR